MLVDAVRDAEVGVEAANLVERVQSDANIADPASRAELGYMARVGVQDSVLAEHFG